MCGSLKSHAIFLVLILGSFFPLATSSSTFQTFIYDKKQSVPIMTEGNKYLEYKIEEGDPSINYILSATSNLNTEKRLQMIQSYLGKASLYVLIQGEISITIEIECSKYPCEGSFSYDFIDKIELNDGEPVQYYVNNEETIEFTLNLNSDLSNVWVRGQKEIQVSFLSPTNANQVKAISDSFYAYIFENSYNSKVEFSVVAKKGDYINVGLIGYSREDDYYHSNKVLNIEGPVITGFLHKNSIQKICYDLKYEQIQDKIVIGSGILFTKIAMSNLISGEEGYSNLEQISPLGILKNFIVKQYSKICFSFPDINALPQYENIKEIVFTYHAETLETKNYLEKEPQLNGLLYPRTIKVESKVAFISQKDGNFEKMSLNLNSLRGFPKMYVYKCENYPLCNYEQDNLKEALKYLNEPINHISISIECKVPKISPKINEMRKNIARILNINENCVGITATSGEDLTEFGKGNGINVFACVTV